MEKFWEVLKVFLEKHLLPSAISLTFALIIVAITPEETMLYTRLGKNLYTVLVFCVGFIVIEAVRFIGKAIWSKRRSIIEDKQQKELQLKRDLEDQWNFVDKLSVAEKKMLMDFLHTNNSPITIKGLPKSNLLISKYVISTNMPSEETINAQDPQGVFGKSGGTIKMSGKCFAIPIRQYKLDEKFYKLLKYSYEIYGRISHFAMEDENNG